jgi:hypothetical protein
MSIRNGPINTKHVRPWVLRASRGVTVGAPRFVPHEVRLLFQ